MVLLAPLIPTALFFAFLVLVIRKGVRDRPDLASKEGSFVDLWLNQRRRLLSLMIRYVVILYAGGLAGAAIANAGVETSFMSLSLASVIGQLGALTLVSVAMTLKRLWSFRGLRRH
jgi:hypothetical protein